MLQNKKHIFSQPRVTQAVLGFSRAEFEQLLPTFSACLIAHRHELKPDRIRRVGGGRKGDLPTDEDKLIYILLYLKLYPTYDALALVTISTRLVTEPLRAFRVSNNTVFCSLAAWFIARWTDCSRISMNKSCMV
jgi:hypothetical protein